MAAILSGANCFSRIASVSAGRNFIDIDVPKTGVFPWPAVLVVVEACPIWIPIIASTLVKPVGPNQSGQTSRDRAINCPLRGLCVCEGHAALTAKNKLSVLMPIVSAFIIYFASFIDDRVGDTQRR